MLRLFFTLFCCIVLAPFIVAANDKNPDYSFEAIPKKLLVNANAVKRFEEVRFTIKNPHKTNYYRHFVLTVLNDKGDKYASVKEEYDKLQSVDFIEGTLYDDAGKKVKSLHKADISDLSGNGGELASDARIKAHNFYCKSYPYTIEYEISISFSHTFYFPGWMPMEDEHLAVVQSGFEVVAPKDYEVRYKAINLKTAPEISKHDAFSDTKTMYWSVKYLPAIEDEYASPDRREIYPAVYIAPSDFELQDYSGNMKTWQAFGKFIYSLNKERDELPDATKKKVHELTDDAKDDREKINRLYKYLQENTHYISIQLGIGGWQTLDANYVATHKYGDCKALSNFMYSLLKEANIKSFYTLISAGEHAHFMQQDFPSNQFNHIIICVPLSHDTVWLECTSQTISAGYLSGFTDDRYALIIHEQGGTIVRTPKYTLKDNRKIENATAKINENGTLIVNATTQYSCMQQDDLHNIINYLSKEKLKERLRRQLDLPQYEINEYAYAEHPSTKPEITEKLKITAENFAQVSNKRLFFTPNILSRTAIKLLPDSARKYDVVLHDSFEILDTANIDVPDGYAAESMPIPVSIENKFGKYTITTSFKDGKLVYCRNLEWFGGRFPASDYNDLVKFRDKIYKADRNKVVLVKK